MKYRSLYEKLEDLGVDERITVEGLVEVNWSDVDRGCYIGDERMGNDASVLCGLEGKRVRITITVLPPEEES